MATALGQAGMGGDLDGPVRRARTGPAPGSTAPGDVDWRPPTGWRAVRRATRIGDVDDWERLRLATLHWVVKRRAGFRLRAGPARAGERLVVTAGVGRLRVVEPVEVVAVVDEPDRAGFAYATLEGHPVAGEEAFVVHRDADGVHLELRSLTRAAPRGPWRWGFGLLRLVQGVALQRYLRALRS